MGYPEQCPQCHREADRQTDRFCSYCRFPLVDVAGKYRLTRRFEEGGAGVLYLADYLQPSPDPHRVIKFIKPQIMKQPNMRKRFWREIKVTSMLSKRNAHIVHVYDYGEEEGLGFFYVMEYLRGQNLRSLLEELGSFPYALAFRVFGQLCDAISAAHKEGILHRDLKPENILLVPRAQDPYFVKVIDFGITKALHKVETKLTQSEIGTPSYMSPEQCLNQGLDTRSDLYSLGIILYELLTGRLPFDEESAISAVLMMQRHVMTPPIPLSKRRPDIAFPPGLEAVVMRALAKKPGDRYASVTHFWEILQPFIEQEPDFDYEDDLLEDSIRLSATELGLSLMQDEPTLHKPKPGKKKVSRREPTLMLERPGSNLRTEELTWSKDELSALAQAANQPNPSVSGQQAIVRRAARKYLGEEGVDSAIPDTQHSIPAIDPQRAQATAELQKFVPPRERILTDTTEKQEFRVHLPAKERIVADKTDKEIRPAALAFKLPDKTSQEMPAVSLEFRPPGPQQDTKTDRVMRGDNMLWIKLIALSSIILMAIGAYFLMRSEPPSKRNLPPPPKSPMQRKDTGSFPRKKTSPQEPIGPSRPKPPPQTFPSP